jgi:preprotein translocase subunit SecF
MIVIKHRKIFYALSGIIGLLSLWALFSFGLKPGLDFPCGGLFDVFFFGATPHAAWGSHRSGQLAIRPSLFV